MANERTVTPATPPQAQEPETEELFTKADLEAARAQGRAEHEAQGTGTAARQQTAKATLVSSSPRGQGITDRGAPGRDDSLNHEGQVWKMTKADVDALIKQKGFQAAAHELRARMRQDLKGVRIMLPRPGS